MGQDVYDVVVAGGGPAGSNAARSLAQAGCKVALVEASLYEWPRIGETVSPEINPLLKHLGLWSAFEKLGSISSFGKKSVWGSEEPLSQSFLFSPDGFGWHLNRPRFDAMLAEEARATGAELMCGARITNCIKSKGGSWQLILESPGRPAQYLNALGLIDATGRKASVARMIGAHRQVIDHLIGIATNLDARQKDEGHVLIEAVESGWWYSAPVDSKNIVSVFMTDPDLARQDHEGIKGSWKRSLDEASHTRRRLRLQNGIRNPRVFSAISHRLRRTGSDDCWLACGDAATAMDPLSGNGVLHALEGGVMAAQAMLPWLDRDPSPAIEYENRLDTAFDSYLQARRAYYLLERRWPDAPFWHRRHMGPGHC